ncbi:MAG: ferrous iron transport protein B [Erysipelotrichaceae bacterium]|nr:ferrous iron transport protein B [Erysipelotrichaceae bacterium]
MADVRLKIALAGNPNSGKTTLFNALTGSNQYVGNWPGVTVEKKEGKLKKHPDVIIEDLPGIYSLSPYTLEEVVSRNYLIGEHPDAILNIVDGTNLERNLYLTTQLLEIGVPVVIAVNMMDLVNKSEDKIDIDALSKKLGCPIVEISALKEKGIMEAAEAAIKAAEAKSHNPVHKFDDKIETALSTITDTVLTDISAEQKRWYAVKVFERDDKILAKLNLDESKKADVEKVIADVEKELDDDAESIITNARYNYITEILKGSYTKQNAGKLSVSDKIDNIVTNRWLGLPIFAVVMFIVYYVSIQTFGTGATDWVNDGLFGDGWFWFGMGREEFNEDSGTYSADQEARQAFIDEAVEKGYITTSEDDEGETEITVLNSDQLEGLTVSAEIHNDEGDIEETRQVTYADYEKYSDEEEPEAASYGPWQDGLPVVLGNFLTSINCAEWLQSLILDGIVAGVGAVLGFLPQMLVLFFFLAFLEGCGYMARIAFVMDRIFRKFGLSGKSFIPMLIGTGCGVPGVMASRTIENERDRRMTVITTTFIPCSAKLPVIALIAGAFFDKSGLVATSAYFLGIAAIVISGITLKKTKMFAGEPAPFVMELPAYHWPTPSNILHSMWERGSSFVKKAGTIILLATVLVWFLQSYGFTADGFGAVEQSESILAVIGNTIKVIFVPLGWGDWRAAVAAITGLIAKENVVGTMGVLYGAGEVAENGWQIFTSMANAFNNNAIAGYSFLAFNLLCAPCFAAIGAIRREMNNGKWTWFAIAYQCGLAYVIALIIYQVGSAVTGNIHPIGLAVAIVCIVAIIWGLVRPGYKEK